MAILKKENSQTTINTQQRANSGKLLAVKGGQANSASDIHLQFANQRADSVRNAQRANALASNNGRSPTHLMKSPVLPQLEDLQAFATTAAPENGCLRCVVRRQGGGLAGGQTFTMEVQGAHQGDVPVLRAVKQGMGITSQAFDIFGAADGAPLLATLRGNFVGDQYDLVSADGATQMACALKDGNASIFEAGAPKHRTVALPLPGQQIRSQALMKHALGGTSGRLTDQVQLFSNRAADWDEAQKRYTQDFAGRVKQTSAKNWQLSDTASAQYGEGIVAMQFGKIDQESFILDLAGPFTPLQAFALACTTLSTKPLSHA